MLYLEFTHSYRKNFFFSLFLTSQLMIGCASKYEINRYSLRGNTEHLMLCKGHPNSVDFLDYEWTFYILPGKPTTQHHHTIAIDASKKEYKTKTASPRVIVADSLTEGDTFDFDRKKWSVVKIGHHGSKVNGLDWCDEEFIHIQQVK